LPAAVLKITVIEAFIIKETLDCLLTACKTLENAKNKLFLHKNHAVAVCVFSEK